MVIDIDEAAASGETARIYAQIRDLWCVPYVSAVHRYMASRPGLLEWAWHCVGPAFADGSAQRAAWAAVDAIPIEALETFDRARLQAWQIDDPARTTVAYVAENFIRVAPVNMMFAALLQRVMAEGAAVAQRDMSADPWPDKPTPLPPLPAMCDPARLPVAEREALETFATDMDGARFVPGLYRMLAHWPGLLVHLAAALPPRLASAATHEAYDLIRRRIDEAAATVPLSPLPDELPAPQPSQAELESFRAIARTYRKTSPEMIVAGRMIKAALPR